MRSRQKKSGHAIHNKAAQQSDDYASSSNSIIADKVLRVTGGAFMLIGLLLVFLAAAGTDGHMEMPGILIFGITGLVAAVLGMVLISMPKVVSKDD